MTYINKGEGCSCSDAYHSTECDSWSINCIKSGDEMEEDYRYFVKVAVEEIKRVVDSYKEIEGYR